MLSAIDADVVKSYVELGLGVAVLADVTFEPDRDRELRAIPVPPICFEPTMPHVVLRRGKHLPGHHVRFHRQADAEMGSRRPSRPSCASVLRRPDTALCCYGEE